MIYLDNNATTKVDEKVLEEMLPFLEQDYANPSSMYDFARKPAAAIREARVKVRDFLGAKNTLHLAVQNLQVQLSKAFLAVIEKNVI